MYKPCQTTYNSRFVGAYTTRLLDNSELLLYTLNLNFIYNKGHNMIQYTIRMEFGFALQS